MTGSYRELNANFAWWRLISSTSIHNETGILIGAAISAIITNLVRATRRTGKVAEEAKGILKDNSQPVFT